MIKESKKCKTLVGCATELQKIIDEQKRDTEIRYESSRWYNTGRGHGEHNRVGSPVYYTDKNFYPDGTCPECGEKTETLEFTSAGYPIMVCDKCAKRRIATLICECPRYYGYTDDEVPDTVANLVDDVDHFKSRYPEYWDFQQIQMVKSENIRDVDEWSLKSKKKNTLHRTKELMYNSYQVYDAEDIETLREKLIEDIEDLMLDDWRTLQVLKEIINRRFGKE